MQSLWASRTAVCFPVHFPAAKITWPTALCHPIMMRQRDIEVMKRLQKTFADEMVEQSTPQLHRTAAGPLFLNYVFWEK
jgi:hypothetical protein